MNPDFIGVICEEFSWAIESVVNPEFLSPQECWDPVVKVLGSDFKPEIFAHISDTQIELLRLAFATNFESNDISAAEMRLAISRILIRWPVGLSEA